MSAIETVTLPRVGTLKMGETIIEKDCTGEGLPIYSADKSNRPWAFSTHFKRLNKRGTIVLGARGTIGYPRLPRDEEFGATQTTITLTPDPENFQSEFVHFALQQLDFTLLGAQQAIPMLTVGNLESVTIPKFPKPEQTKIAEILSTVDRAIEQTEALIAKQQRLKTGLMQDLLTRGIDEHGNLRSEQTYKFKDSPLGRIPVEWEVCTISSVLTQSPKNGYSPVESDIWNGTYMLGLGCLTLNGFKPKQLKSAPKKTTSIEGALLEPGDFLISRSNTRSLVGLVGIFHDIGDPCIYPDLMVRLRFSSEVSPEYMEQVFMSPLIRRQIENVATGTSGSMVKISGAIIKQFQFKKPTIEEQSRILEVLRAKSVTLLKMNGNLLKLRSLKTALMQDLLTGRKRVTSILTPE
jgi:type I restriction enzyme S subunit